MAKIIKMKDLLKKEGIELGKVYTAKDNPPFKVEGKLTEARYKTISLKDKKGFKEAERLQRQGWVVKHVGLFTIDMVKEGVNEGKLTEKINQSKVNQSFTRVIAFVRKEAKKLNEDDLYAMTQKLAKWFK